MQLKLSKESTAGNYQLYEEIYNCFIYADGASRGKGPESRAQQFGNGEKSWIFVDELIVNKRCG